MAAPSALRSAGAQPLRNAGQRRRTQARASISGGALLRLAPLRNFASAALREPSVSGKQYISPDGCQQTLVLMERRADNLKSSGHIRSYVLRQGRVSNAQQRALDTLKPQFGISYTPQLLDLNAVFGRDAPRILEIGFGMGETTAAMALAHPQDDYLAIEVHSPGVGSLLKQIEEKQLRNIRIIQHDAVEVLRDMLADGVLDGVHIFFPDPWHKTRHNKRRLIQPLFVAQLAKKLKHGGYVHVATDWQDYAEQALTVLKAEPLLQNSAVEYAPRPDYRPLTKFEQRGLKLGHGVWDLIFLRKENL